jgi:CheY-specific phosphatase CheX
MTTQTLPPHLVTSLQQAAREILETMVFLSPTQIEEVPETTSSFRSEVVGLLGFTGTRSGNFVVRTSEQMARTIAAKMLMMEPAELATFAEAADGFGELVNMLSGNFKNAWVAAGNQMDLSVPNVIHNGEVRVNSEHEGSLRSCVRVHIDDQTLDVGVHFEASR